MRAAEWCHSSALLLSLSASCAPEVADSPPTVSCVDPELLEGSIEIASDENFLQLPAGCFAVSDDLLVQGEVITDASRLSELVSVGGSLKIDGTSITGLDMKVLQAVGCDLAVTNNRTLGAASSPLLAHVGGLLSIVGNERMIALELSQLESVASVWVSACAVSNLDGFRNLKRIDGGSASLLNVSFNPSLETVSGLAQLERFEGKLLLDGNGLLSSVEGLEALTQLASLDVGATAVTSLAPLGSVTSVTGDVRIALNPRLVTLGLSSLSRIDDDLTIADNPEPRRMRS